jgi:cytochrome d ubiquinol oxidase subunit I
MECSWIVTEVGRQPWIVYKLLRTKDAVTTSSGVPVTLAAMLALYLVLSLVSVGVPYVMSRRWRREDPDAEDAEDAEQTPYGPPPDNAADEQNADESFDSDNSRDGRVGVSR